MDFGLLQTKQFVLLVSAPVLVATAMVLVQPAQDLSVPLQIQLEHATFAMTPTVRFVVQLN